MSAFLYGGISLRRLLIHSLKAMTFRERKSFSLQHRAAAASERLCSHYSTATSTSSETSAINTVSPPPLSAANFNYPLTILRQYSIIKCSYRFLVSIVKIITDNNQLILCLLKDSSKN